MHQVNQNRFCEIIHYNDKEIFWHITEWMRHWGRYVSYCHIMVWIIQARTQSRSSVKPLLWRHNGRDGVSNHQPHDCLLNHSFRRRSKQTSKFRVTSLCAWNSPLTGEFPAQMASSAETVSIWWRHHEMHCKSKLHWVIFLRAFFSVSQTFWNSKYLRLLYE